MTWDSVRVDLPPTEIPEWRSGQKTGRMLAMGGHTYKRVDHRFTGQFYGYGVFCTLRCCETFANAAYRAGYRGRAITGGMG